MAPKLSIINVLRGELIIIKGALLSSLPFIQRVTSIKGVLLPTLRTLFFLLLAAGNLTQTVPVSFSTYSVYYPPFCLTQKEGKHDRAEKRLRMRAVDSFWRIFDRLISERLVP